MNLLIILNIGAFVGCILFDLHIAIDERLRKKNAIDLNLLHNQLHVRWLISSSIKA